MSDYPLIDFAGAPGMRRSGIPAEWAEGLFHRLTDAAFRRWPRPAPPRGRLRACRLIAHRGAHDNRRLIENTIAAFDAADAGGVWGIELDVRWTRDNLPVVFHDADTGRLFSGAVRIDALAMADLRKRFPLIPLLDDVIERYGGRRHLMIEIKEDMQGAPAVRYRRLQAALAPLAPERDFHLLCFAPQLFDGFDQLPPRTFLPIVRARTDRFSRMAATRGWGGLTGHYLAITKGVVRRHHRRGQRIGTGFADSRRCLHREVARGVDWIFSNRSVEMQAACNRG